MTLICPHCGLNLGLTDRSLIADHAFDGQKCPGSGQAPRHAESDRRPLWKDEGMGRHKELIVIDELANCGCCGGHQVWIRPSHPGGPERTVCPTCLADRLEEIHRQSDPNYGRAVAVDPEIPC